MHLLHGVVLSILATACTSTVPEEQRTTSTHEARQDLSRIYAQHQLSGSFILHDAARDHWVYIDSSQADVATLPASTFKIFGSLFALETGAVPDAEHVIVWDGNDYGRPVANRDQDLRSAYDASVYWYYREVVRRAGPEVFKRWLDTVHYGNADTSGGYDRCWVRGGLRITPREQIRFLEQVHREELPFSPRTYAIVKDIMVREDTLSHVMRAKTGWAAGDQGSIGWYVGWVEAPHGGPWFFANRVLTSDTTHATFAEARIAIAKEVLRELGVWP
ncbi:MAG: class D beta-lactamase [Flavobacteriales bacterium]|nr:class D beta-lactamase [Flavobacteriales bacterium]